MENVEKLKEILRESSNVVFFGGAGVSTESNIPDFRSNKGLFNAKNNFKYPPEVMLSRSFFDSHKEEFYRFYKSNMIFKEARPNLAHKALAKLEEMGKLKTVITQNIDGLHQMAGSKNVLELHGSINRNYCMDCGAFYDLEYILKSGETIPTCEKCGGIVKPDVVLYEEGLDMDVIQKSVEYIAEADVLIVGGTSLVVYPAAGLIQYFKGTKLILINKKSTPYDKKAKLVINDSIGKVMAEAINLVE
ncbi:NAD-dependent protein deacylase [Clostridium sp. KNHs214]|uniref:NAD-dependent protein deacylase n=1 Tax=Clostridium sp. KNHs214 TaxID=1540257 RepID=UPI00055356EE|nr:NAD-dependent protein deacylase [Clostridium sp. KNHs214]